MAQHEFRPETSGGGPFKPTPSIDNQESAALSQYLWQRSDMVAAFLTGSVKDTSPYDDIVAPQQDPAAVAQAWMHRSFMNDGLPAGNYYGKRQGRVTADWVMKSPSILEEADSRRKRLFKLDK